MASKVKRTYSSRSKVSLPSSSPSSSPLPLKRKASIPGDETDENEPPRKKLFAGRSKSSNKPVANSKQKFLTQLHFSLETSVLKTCSLCDLSYTRGAPDDEALHRAHCIRVQRGMEWGREEQREAEKAGVEEVDSGVKMKDGKKGRIICFRADVGGKIGSKLSILLETINLTLASPPLTLSVLKASKAYLFLIPSLSSSRREKIVGCAIAQRISTAMAIADPEDIASSDSSTNDVASVTSAAPPTTRLVAVDVSTGLFCHPAALPTPLGIPRLFVSSSHRRQGIASHLLTAAAATSIYGCPLNPLKGEVAFTQPTGAGSAVMSYWGKGRVRIYEE
ncbi:hypothetical protein BJ138DRAFT_1173778 [Hygrophoropsis aurantiaca]|uniref:Uncharacterized protein n=1 Tax=Hygrophoropsis aurantiaca TaxID=72124 RepID=A0ACB8A7M3_9AGAM|nr:hypothetical protein BJ138DRAFT_1173778 [Hygrophoropsis aurantiaca]